MPHSACQEDVILTLEDFSGCGWKEALAGSDREEYYFIWRALSTAAEQAIDEDRQAHGKVLSLLACACWVKFSPDSVNEPFRPLTALQGQRSIVPDILSETDIAFFAQIVDEIDGSCPKVYLLKARLADLVWLLQQPRNIKFALVAIDSYRSVRLDKKVWRRVGDKCWQRAIKLACLLKKGDGGRLAGMEAAIIETLMSVTREDDLFGCHLAELLKSNTLGRDHPATIATKLESLAHEFEDKGEFRITREYFHASAGWYKVSGDDAKSVEMTVEMAENWVKEALSRVSSDQPSHMVASTCYEKAIWIYRTIPKSMRVRHRVDDRIAELRGHLSESGRKSLDEMIPIDIPGVDIGQMIEDARNSVKGKSLVEALKVFVNHLSSTNVKELRKSAIERIRDYPMQSMFSRKLMSRDGRVIAKRPGISLSVAPSDDDEEVIRSKMVENYYIYVDLAVRGYIWPAQEVLLLEHRLQEIDFVNLAKQSPIVPVGRELLFGKALFAGYDRDFVTALHILVPQIEHMVRCHLKQAGVQTTNIDGKGIEHEKGLSSLMDLPQTEEIFGEDSSFEIRALFCDPFGPNLRNGLAHGLLNVGDCYSSNAIYAWWLGLKLVFNIFWHVTYGNAENKEQKDME